MLASMRPVVRHIAMYRSGRPEELIGTIDTYRVWLDIFSLFPYVKSLQMELYVVEELETNMICAVLNKISTSPAFDTLQSLNIERRLIGHGRIHTISRPHNMDLFAALQYYNYTGLLLSAEDYYDALPTRDQDFLGPWINEIVVPPPIPRRLNKLGVSLTRVMLAPAPSPPSDFNSLIRAALGTITELRITADSFISFPEHLISGRTSPPGFSFLVKVTIIINKYSLTRLADVGQWFPNLKVLVVSDGPTDPYASRGIDILDLLSQQEQTMSRAIQGMKGLNMVRLPRPYIFEDPYNFGIRSLNHWQKVYFPPERLENIVDKWVRAGADNLKQVIFATEYFSYSGRDDKMVVLSIRKEGSSSMSRRGWRLEVKECNDHIDKLYDNDISI
ncbi:hypothetical protein TWF281_008715 [Arthrobotrys megalospora]